MGDVDIHVAVMIGDRRDVKKYIIGRGDLEVRDEDGATPLFHAAFWTHVEVAKDLIAAGADVNAQRRNDGFTPLHVAVKNNQPRMTNVLVNAMADLSVQEDFGDTPLHWAYRSKSTECIDILLTAGADTEILNLEGKSPKECEGTGVDRQDDVDDEEYERRGHQSSMVSDAPSAGDASTVVDDSEIREELLTTTPSRPIAGRSTVASTSPRINHRRSGVESEDARRAHFRVGYPPNIKAGGKWHRITAYLFEPSASRAVRQEHQARVSGAHSSFSPEDTVEDGDRAIPPGTEVTVRPRFPWTCCVNPVHATLKWMKDVHTLSFEVRPPASASSGTIGGSIDFYVGPVLVSQAPVEMAVVTSSDSAEDSEVLGPVTKIFDTAYMCYAPADEELLLPCLKNFNRLGVANLTWRPEYGMEKETKDLIREASVFQICWSCAAKTSGRVKGELKYAASLAKAGSMAVRGIYWDSTMNATSVKTDHGLVFPVRLHNQFLLDEACGVLGTATSSCEKVSRDTSSPPPSPVRDASTLTGGNYSTCEKDAKSGISRGAAGQEMGKLVMPEKLCTAAVEQTRGYISRLRTMMEDASAVDVPRVVWLYPADGANGADVDLKTDAWLKKPIRLTFLCPISMKPARCGEDGKGYLMTLPRGWGSKIGIALKIGVVITAAASDTGELAGLPVLSCSGQESSAEWQGQVVNAAYDGLTGGVDAKANDSIDTAFMEADTEAASMAPSSQLCKETKQSYTNLRTLVLKYDKGLQMTGLVKVTSGSTSEWVHPSVAELFRKEGPRIFKKEVLQAADRVAATAATSAARNARHNVGGGGDASGRSNTKEDVLSTLRLLKEQILAMGETGASGA